MAGASEGGRVGRSGDLRAARKRRRCPRAPPMADGKNRCSRCAGRTSPRGFGFFAHLMQRVSSTRGVGWTYPTNHGRGDSRDLARDKARPPRERGAFWTPLRRQSRRGTSSAAKARHPGNDRVRSFAWPAANRPNTSFGGASLCGAWTNQAMGAEKETVQHAGRLKRGRPATARRHSAATRSAPGFILNPPPPPRSVERMLPTEIPLRRFCRGPGSKLKWLRPAALVARGRRTRRAVPGHGRRRLHHRPRIISVRRRLKLAWGPWAKAPDREC